MPKLVRFAAIAAAVTALSAATPALAAPINVGMRIEGPTKTVYEGGVSTDIHDVDGHDGSGAHPCNGLNGGNTLAYSGPAPSVTSAMDDAAAQNGFAWNGRWYSGMEDFLVNQIGSEAAPSGSPAFWTFTVNWTTYPNNGGCQVQVRPGDQVVWAFAEWGAPWLELTGTPARVATNEAFVVTVRSHDGSGSTSVAAGASVGGSSTDSAGQATLAFADPGVRTLKAERAGAVRSNAQSVCVYVPGSGDCGTERASTEAGSSPTEPGPAPPPVTPAPKDTTPPTVRITSPADGKTYRRGPRVLGGAVDDAGGIAQVFLRLRATDGGDLTSASRCRWFSHKRSVFTHRTVPCSRARFFRIGSVGKFSYLLPARLRRGKYVLDVKVLDRSYNAGRSSVAFGVK